MAFTQEQVAILNAMHTMGELVWVPGGNDAAVHDVHSDAVVELDGRAAAELLELELIEPALPSDPGKAAWYLTDAGAEAAQSVAAGEPR